MDFDYLETQLKNYNLDILKFYQDTSNNQEQKTRLEMNLRLVKYQIYTYILTSFMVYKKPDGTIYDTSEILDILRMFIEKKQTLIKVDFVVSMIKNLILKPPVIL